MKLPMKICRKNGFLIAILCVILTIFLTWDQNALISSRIRSISEIPTVLRSAEIYKNVEIQESDIEVNGHTLIFNKQTALRHPRQLNINLIFHSHVDPGWLMTFEKYYQEQTKNIITSTVAALMKYPQLKFIWSEMSFLERWWRDANETQKANALRVVKEGRLELTGGAWVMTDEATPLFYSSIENFIEGHQFVRNTFKTSPNTSWSVDPFGHGAMLPQLLTLSGIESMVIGRFNSHAKDLLKAQQSLRWKWVPMAGPGKAARVNSLPYTVYTTQDAGPDHSICICYHVGPSVQYNNCNPEHLLTGISEANASFYVNRFVDQMRRVQELYGSEDLLVAIGDDFFFQQIGDFDAMVNGYSTMMKYIDKHPELNVTMRFSTVSDFFNKIENEKLPTLRGDFFPYTANEANYPWWSGFFVHRPYTKTMERRLQNSLRSLDLLRSVRLHAADSSKLQEARRDFLIFQHHDGITGTSRPLVMQDYEERMIKSQTVIEELFASDLKLSGKSLRVLNSTTGALIPIEKSAKFLLFFSSQTLREKQLLSFRSMNPFRIFFDQEEIPTQTIQITHGQFVEYETSFHFDLDPLTITKFELKPSDQSPNRKPKAVTKSCFSFSDNGRIKGFFGRKLDFEFLTVMDRGGAYVFEPVGETTSLNISKFEDEQGEVFFRRRYSFIRSKLTVEFTCIDEDEIAVDIWTDVEIEHALIMTIKTDISSVGFHTDINGMFHTRRRFEPKQKFEANVFPTASSAFLQDRDHRLTVFTGQPTGVSSRKEGMLDILLDRRVSNNDGKGIGYGDSLDIRSSHLRFRMLMEKRDSVDEKAQVAHSVRGSRVMDSFIYYPIGIFSNNEPEELPGLPFVWPCTVQLVLWRHLEGQIQHLVLRRAAYEESIPVKGKCSTDLIGLFDYFSSKFTLRHSSLTANEIKEEVTLESFEKALSTPLSIASFQLRISDR